MEPDDPRTDAGPPRSHAEMFNESAFSRLEDANPSTWSYLDERDDVHGDTQSTTGVVAAAARQQREALAKCRDCLTNSSEVPSEAARDFLGA